MVSGSAPRRMRDLLAGCDWVKSVTQLGNRLRVTVEREAERPAARVRELLSSQNPDVTVDATQANLEDVFVAATRSRCGHMTAFG